MNKDKTKTSRDQRLNFRASAHQELMIRRAAEASDSTITDFILDSVLENAQRVLADRQWGSSQLAVALATAGCDRP